MLAKTKEKDVIDQLLDQIDFHGKGDHDIYYSPITKRNFTVDSKIKSRHTANAIMKQSGIEYHF